MTLFRPLFISALVFFLIGTVAASSNSNNYYRNFWSPMYLGQRLNYCTLNGKECGLPVASRYCRMMGYEKADQEIIDNNVGVTNFLLCRARCIGWTCSSFKLIRCVSKIVHKPPQGYYYRSRDFVFPRFDHYRVAWCYAKGKGCGQRTAYSFCRRMGYMRAAEFNKEEHVPATKTLGDQKLCFGNECSGFRDIVCYR